MTFVKQKPSFIQALTSYKHWPQTRATELYGLHTLAFHVEFKSDGAAWQACSSNTALESSQHFLGRHWENQDNWCQECWSQNAPNSQTFRQQEPSKENRKEVVKIRPRGSGSPQNAQNIEICCGLFRTVYSSSDRRQLFRIFVIRSASNFTYNSGGGCLVPEGRIIESHLGEEADRLHTTGI